ncbi:MAG: class A beta-lactamase-related serine hydrolase, partial [Calditrichaeota bacterium]
QPIEKDTFLQEVFAAPLDFEPGSSYRYSNIGYSLLAIIIEQVTGQDYETCLHELLFQKAGMQQTGYLLPKWDDSQLAHGYKCGEDWGTHLQKWREDANQIAYHLKGNGGILSTPLDMYKWYLALKNNMIISQKSIEQLTYPYVKENEAGDSFYAYGWAIFTSDRDTKIVAHNGSNGVFYADFVQLPEEDAVIIYLTNQMRYDTPRVAWEIEKLLFDPTYEPIVPKMNTVPYAANDTSNSHLKVIRQFINLILKPVPGSDVDKFVRENVANEKRYNRFKMWVSDMQSGFVAHRLKHVLQYGDGSYDIMLESGDGKEIEMTPCFDLQFDENGKIAAFGW